MKTLALATCLIVSGFAAGSSAEASANLDIVGSGQPSPGSAPSATPATTGSVAPNAETPASDPEKIEKRRRSAGKALGFEGGRRARVADLIAKHAKDAGVPLQLADAVVRIESRYNPSARNGGAVGLMQIKPQTARGLGYAGGAAGLMNPDTNLRYGMRYLAAAYRLSNGDTCATVMRYQSGHYARRINAANRAYCSKARTIMASGN